MSSHHHRAVIAPLAGRVSSASVKDRVPSTQILTSVVLWSLVVTFAVLDIALTRHGLTIGLVELNPFGRAGLAVFGSKSLVVGKLLALMVGVLCWRLLQDYRHLVPASYCLCWGTAVFTNAALIFAAG